MQKIVFRNWLSSCACPCPQLNGCVFMIFQVKLHSQRYVLCFLYYEIMVSTNISLHVGIFNFENRDKLEEANACASKLKTDERFHLAWSLPRHFLCASLSFMKRSRGPAAVGLEERWVTVPAVGHDGSAGIGLCACMGSAIGFRVGPLRPFG